MVDKTGADWRVDFEAFVARARERLEAGEVEYGNKSFERSPLAILAEIEDECLDLAGWGFVLWTRVQSLAATRVLSDSQVWGSPPDDKTKPPRA